MIRETCSCGAQIEINFGSSAGSREQTTISEWRREHRHEAKINYLPPSYPHPFPSQVYGSGEAGVGGFTLNEDFVEGTNGEPVWIGKGPLPEYWDQWATAYTKCNQPVDNS